MGGFIALFFVILGLFGAAEAQSIPPRLKMQLADSYQPLPPPRGQFLSTIGVVPGTNANGADVSSLRLSLGPIWNLHDHYRGIASLYGSMAAGQSKAAEGSWSTQTYGANLGVQLRFPLPMGRQWVLGPLVQYGVRKDFFRSRVSNALDAAATTGPLLSVILTAGIEGEVWVAGLHLNTQRQTGRLEDQFLFGGLKW